MRKQCSGHFPVECCRQCRSALARLRAVRLPSRWSDRPRISRPHTASSASGRCLAWHLLRERGQLAVEAEKRRAAAEIRAHFQCQSHSCPHRRNPSQWHRMRVIWPFVTIVALMLLLGNASLEVMSGMRALANAESARSKALAVRRGRPRAVRADQERERVRALSRRNGGSRRRCGTPAPSSPRPVRTSTLAKQRLTRRPHPLRRCREHSSTCIAASAASDS